MSAPAKKRLLLLIILGLILIGLGYYIFSYGKITTDDAAIEAHIIPIDPKISGYVVALNVNDNQQVKAGDLLLAIDPADYQIALDRANASLDLAKANLDKANADLKRILSVSPQARSKQDVDSAVAVQSTYSAAVRQAEEDVAQAQVNLKDTQLIAPVDGKITKRGVELGAYVQPGQQLMAVVGNDYWVIANYKETQLTHITSGQPVDIVIDAYPAKTYHGKVDSVQSGTGARFSAFPPENATGNYVKIVQRVPVKIIFDERPDASIPVGPGMSVSPVIHAK